MISISINKLLEITKGTSLNFTTYDSVPAIEKITIDARTPCENNSNAYSNLFIALESDTYNQDFLIQQAINSNYDVILTNSQSKIITDKLLIKVDNCIHALQQLAGYVRDQVNPLVIAITGSCGKTSLKEILFSIFNGEFPNQVLATQGNLNNHIGVPLTLLNLTKQHKVAIVEHGASHIGEIESITQFSKPDIACINNVQPAHTEGFGSILGVALAKTEIFSHLNDHGVRLVNLDSYYIDPILSNVNQQKLVTVSANQGISDLFIDQTSIKLTTHGLKFNLEVGASKLNEVANYLRPNNNHQDKFIDPQTLVVESNLIGKHNIYNLTMAIAIALYAGLYPYSILTHIKSLKTYQGRNHFIQLTDHLSILDDCYNANLGSVDAMFETIKLFNDYQKIVVLGKLVELNDSDLIDFYTNVYERAIVNREFELLSLIKFVDEIDHNSDLKILKLNKYNKYVVLENYQEPILTARVKDFLQQQLVNQEDYFTSTPNKLIAFKGSHSSNLQKSVSEITQFIKNHSEASIN